MIEQAIGEALLAQEDIASIVGDRIILGGMPEEFPYPCIIMLLVSERAWQVNQGRTNQRDAVVRLDFYGDDYATVRTLLEAARSVLVSEVIDTSKVFAGPFIEENATFLAPQDPDELWHSVLDLSFTYSLKG